jgi:RimJ/RimL family protein N-acetyltransferase
VIVYDQKLRVGRWVMARTGFVDDWGNYEAIGLEKGGDLIAGVVYNQVSEFNCSMHVAAIPGRRWLTREYLNACFRYPFVQLGLLRVTGLVPAKNQQALRFDLHLGFKVEGIMRRCLGSDDLVVLGMLREECRYGQVEQPRTRAA